MVNFHALLSPLAVPLLRACSWQIPAIRTTSAHLKRVYLSSTRVAQLEDNETTMDINDASIVGDALRIPAYTKHLAATPEPSGKLASVPVLVKEDVHDAHRIDLAAPHSVVSNSVLGPQFYTNREGLVSEREILSAAGRSWSAEELVLLQKLHLQGASVLELQASFPNRTQSAVLIKLRLCCQSRRSWPLADRELLVSKLAEGYSYEQIRSRWFPSRTLCALRNASDPGMLKRQESKTISPKVTAELVKLVQAGKTPFEISQALPNIPQFAWHIRKVRASLRNYPTSPGCSRQTYPYSDDEWQHVLELHAKGLSVPEIAAAVNRSIQGIQNRLNAHNILANPSTPLHPKRPWTDAEHAVLEPYIHNRVQNFAELRSVLNRSTSSIATKLSTLRARHNVTEGLRSKNWTEAEVGLLQSKIDQYHPYKDARIVSGLAKSFGRTRKAIYSKLQALRLQKKEAESSYTRAKESSLP